MVFLYKYFNFHVYSLWDSEGSTLFLSFLSFYHKWVLGFKYFFCIFCYDLTCLLYTLYISNCINFWSPNQTCIAGIYSSWSSCSIYHIHNLTFFANIVLKIFVFTFVRNIVLYFSFLSGLYIICYKDIKWDWKCFFPLFSKFVYYFFFK